MQKKRRRGYRWSEFSQKDLCIIFQSNRHYNTKQNDGKDFLLAQSTTAFVKCGTLVQGLN